MSKRYLYPMNLPKEKMKTDDEYFIGFKSDKRIRPFIKLPQATGFFINLKNPKSVASYETNLIKNQSIMKNMQTNTKTEIS